MLLVGTVRNGLYKSSTRSTVVLEGHEPFDRGGDAFSPEPLILHHLQSLIERQKQ